MLFDYSSILLALGFAGSCLAVTLFATWLSSRNETFILTWAIGLGLIVLHSFIYGAYVQRPATLLAMGAFVLLILGLALLYVASALFRGQRMSLPGTAAIIAVAFVVGLSGFAMGVDGVGFIMTNLVCAGFLFATAWQYAQARQEAPGAILGLVILYSLVGLSFVLCAGVLAWGRSWHLGHAPDNWAEEVNVVVSVAALAGIGALSLALNQARLARSHRRDARTDALTGLLNRRALFDLFNDSDLPPFTSVVVFDLDRFKMVNDTHGHPAGDEVLRRFADTLRWGVRSIDTVARLGGEEFAVVLPRSNSESAVQVAERIRRAFADLVVPAGDAEIRRTVSAGVATAGAAGHSFDEVLRNADDALYVAKRNGRDRVATEPLRLVS